MTYKYINSSFPKTDGVGLLLGKPVYTDDLPIHQPLVVKILRSPHAFAKIINIDTAKAIKLPGVACILTYQDVPRIPFTRAGQSFPEPSPYDKFLLDEYVRYVGDEVAIIAAVDENTALKAMQSIKVAYQVLQPILDLEQAEGNTSIIHNEPEIFANFEIGFNPKQNLAATFVAEVGNTADVLSNCAHVVRNTYYTQGQAHVMMETHRAAAHFDHQGRLVITTSTQVPFHVRRIVARALELPISKIRIIKPRIGGGFGGKQALHGEIIVAAVALKTGQAAKLVYTRKEAFESTYRRHPIKYTVTLGADSTGLIKTIHMEGISDTGAYGEHAPTVFSAGGLKSLPMYNKVEAVKFEGKVVYTNQVPSGALRGYGVPQANFALESAINELAVKMSLDPIKLREINMIAPGESSPIYGAGNQDEQKAQQIVTSCHLQYCIRRGKELIGWHDKYPRQIVGPELSRGVGMAVSMQGCGIANIDMGAATIKLNEDGFFNLLVGATDIGTGSDTILAQIAAEVLQVDLNDIVVYSSDTDLTPFDTGAYASSTTYVTGNAVKIAAEKMIDLIKEAGAQLLGVDSSKVFYNGKEIAKNEGAGSISLAELSQSLLYRENQQQLVASGSYVGHLSPPPFMAGFAEVEVDLATGKIFLLNYVGVVDGGTIINPNLARIQVEGGLVQGIGYALFEETRHNKKGKLINNSLLRYKIPTRRDFGKLTVEFANSFEETGPFGAKSVGEICINTPAGAIADAVYNATGVRVRSLPITPEKVLTGLWELDQR